MKKLIAATGLVLLGAGVVASPAAAESKISGQPDCKQIHSVLKDELSGLSLQTEKKDGTERTSCTFGEARDKPTITIVVRRTDITDGDLEAERTGYKAQLKNSSTSEYVHNSAAEPIGFAIHNKTGRTEVFANNFMLTMHKMKSGFAPRSEQLVVDKHAQIKTLVKLRGQLSDRI